MYQKFGPRSTLNSLLKILNLTRRYLSANITSSLEKYSKNVSSQRGGHDSAQKKRQREKIKEAMDVLGAIIIEHKNNWIPCTKMQ